MTSAWSTIHFLPHSFRAGNISLLQTAWPDDDVDMGSDFGASQLNDALSAGGGLLPRLNAGSYGFAGPQQAFSALVVRRFKVSTSSSPRLQYEIARGCPFGER